MFVRLLVESLSRQRRRKLIVLASVMLGTATAAALANLALQVEDGVARELRRFGANIVIQPTGGSGRVILGGLDITGARMPVWLDESDLPHVRDNFWKNNILEFGPELDVAARIQGAPILLRGAWFRRVWSFESGDSGTSGLAELFPDWSVEGSWPPDSGPGAPVGGEIPLLLGWRLAERIGAVTGRTLSLEAGGSTLQGRVSGILNAGDEWDDLVLAPLAMVQATAALEGKFDRVRVSAHTTPETEFSRRLGVDPAKFSAADYEMFTCTPFASSIAHELQRAWPGTEATPVRRIAETEGRVLGRIGGLMALIAVIATVSAALAVASALTTSVLERRREIGLFKALGSGTSGILTLFLAEAGVIGCIGGAAGALIGAGLSASIRRSVFDSPGDLRPGALLLGAGAAALITLAGAAFPARRIARLRAAEALRG